MADVLQIKLLSARFLLLCCAALILLSSGCRADDDDNGAPDAGLNPVRQTAPLHIRSADGDRTHRFDVEIARTPAHLQMGLMYRREMPDNHGMLFVFADNAERRFWMKNTFIPLDMVFIREDGIIHHIHANAIPHDLTGVPSNGPVRAVLEINGGMAEKLSIRAGDKVFHDFFGNSLAE